MHATVHREHRSCPSPVHDEQSIVKETKNIETSAGEERCGNPKRALNQFHQHLPDGSKNIPPWLPARCESLHNRGDRKALRKNQARIGVVARRCATPATTTTKTLCQHSQFEFHTYVVSVTAPYPLAGRDNSLTRIHAN